MLMLMWLQHLLGCIISWSCGGQCHLAAWNMLHTSAFTYMETGSTLGGPATLDRLKGVDRVMYLRMIYILTINHKTHRIIHSYFQIMIHLSGMFLGLWQLRTERQLFTAALLVLVKARKDCHSSFISRLSPAVGRVCRCTHPSNFSDRFSHLRTGNQDVVVTPRVHRQEVDKLHSRLELEDIDPSYSSEVWSCDIERALKGFAQGCWVYGEARCKYTLQYVYPEMLTAMARAVEDAAVATIISNNVLQYLGVEVEVERA